LSAKNLIAEGKSFEQKTNKPEKIEKRRILLVSAKALKSEAMFRFILLFN
jgi:hypothetical protein